MRAPVAPSGCPSEMPPPFGFTSPACQRSSQTGVRERLEHDRGERLVDLDHGHVVPAEPGAPQAPRAQAGGLPWSIRYGSTPASPNETNRARGSRPSRVAAASLDDEHRGGAVDDLARAPRGDDAVLHERRLERGELLGRGVAPRRLVDDEQHCAPSASDDRHDLATRSARRRSRRSRAGSTRASRRRAPRATGPTPSRSPRRRCPAARSATARRSSRSSLRSRRPRDSSPSARGTSTRPGRDDDVEVPGLDRGGGVERGLHRRAALAVDGRRGAPSRASRRRAPRSRPTLRRLLADLRHAPHLHVLDLRGIEADRATRPLSTSAARSSARTVASVPLRRPIGRADGVDDEGVGHVLNATTAPSVPAHPDRRAACGRRGRVGALGRVGSRRRPGSRSSARASGDPRLEPGEVHAEADVRPVRERDLQVERSGDAGRSGRDRRRPRDRGWRPRARA